MKKSGRILYFDPFSGVSGDMLIGALIDLGAPEEVLTATIHALSQGVEVAVKDQSRGGIMGKRIFFHIPEGGNAPLPKGLDDFLRLLQSATSLSAWVKEKATKILHLIFQAEAEVHGEDIHNIHLHELGSLDTLFDITGALSLIETLEVSSIFSAPLPISRGWIESAHGKLPIPAPAVAKMLEGVPVVGDETTKELVTPTGIAILKGIVDEFAPFPEMVVERIGHGAGGTELEDRPNLLRAWLGKEAQDQRVEIVEMITVLDDCTGEVIAHVQELLLERGALDVYVIPVIMKKGRPGVELHVLSPVGQEARFIETLFEETTTIGIRFRGQKRVCLPRKRCSISTPWGEIEGKEIDIFGKMRTYPEFESARRLSRKRAIPLVEIYGTVRP